MAISFSFILRSGAIGKPVTVCLRIRPNRQNWVITTPCSILPSQWDAKKQRPSTKGDNINNDYLKGIKATLDGIEAKVSEYMNDCTRANREPRKEDVATIVKTKGMARVVTMSAPTDMTEYLDYLIGAMETGDFQFKAEIYDKDTIRVYKVFRTVFVNFRAEYEKRHKCTLDWGTFENDGQLIHSDFVKFCNNWGYMPTTINKYLICFKSFVRYASKRHHLHTNTDSLELFTKVKEKEEASQTKIYLNDTEIEALYNMPLEPGSLKDKVRDIFLIGCYTGQRVSDYNHLTRANFITLEDGTKVVRVRQQKTKNIATIPVYYQHLRDIEEKYDYNVPSVSEVILNRYIKAICKDLSATVPTLAKKYVTVLTLPERRAEDAHRKKHDGQSMFERDEEGRVLRPKYELVGTHTARRSGITNLYKISPKIGLTTLDMMSISGHKTESIFFKYLSQSREEIATGIMEKLKKAGFGNY